MPKPPAKGTNTNHHFGPIGPLKLRTSKTKKSSHEEGLSGDFRGGWTVEFIAKPAS